MPHAGHAALLRAIGNRPSFAYTSNVDGQLLKAGWSPKRLVECHGRIRAFQCLADCGEPIWDASDTRIEVDLTTCRAVGELPTCPSCGGLARPNILMFMDGEWDGAGTDLQHELFENWWFSQNPKRVVVIECGASSCSEREPRSSASTPARARGREEPCLSPAARLRAYT